MKNFAKLLWKIIKFAWKSIKFLTAFIFYTAISMLVIAILALGYIFYNLNTKLPPNITNIEDYNPMELSIVYSDDGEVIGEFFLQKRIVVQLEKIPDHVIYSFVASEDRNFFNHKGLDYTGIIRALIVNLQEKKIVQGGSTITQQVVKNLFLTPERSLQRKLKEVIMAFKIESQLTKEQILYLYLNQIYLGHGAYGVQAAANIYFGKDVSSLTLAESSMLAGLPQAPSRYSPYNHFNEAKERQIYVLDQMVQEGYITEEEASQAKEEPLNILSSGNINTLYSSYFVEYVRLYVKDKYGMDNLYGGGLQIYTTLNLSLQKAACEAIQKGLKEIDRRQGFHGPIKTLTKEEVPIFLKEVTQKIEANSSISENKISLKEDEVYEGVVLEVKGNLVIIGIGPFKVPLAEEDVKWTYQVDILDKLQRAKPLKIRDVIKVKVKKDKNNKEKWIAYIEQKPVVQGALISLDLKTGYVKALVGGYDFEESQFNRATQAYRQVGSAFKPIIYSAALDKNYHQTSVLIDSPISFKLANGTWWTPKNYKNQYSGPQTLRNALTKSINTISVKLLQNIGIDYVIDYAMKLGIKSKLPRNYSIALGSADLTLLELTQAYSVFGAGGFPLKPIFVKQILDRKGNIIEDNTKVNLPKEINSSPEDQKTISKLWEDEIPTGYVIPPATAYIMTDMLKNVVERGTGQRVKALGRPAAGKTGTTNNYNDAWFIGYIPQMITGVWVGLDDHRSLGEGETGGKTAAPLWLYYMQEAVKILDLPPKDFDVPPDVIFLRTDRLSAYLEGNNLASSMHRGEYLSFKRKILSNYAKFSDTEIFKGEF